MRAEFEEKSYEQHLTSELVHSRKLFFPPGQVLEDIIGFDVALHTSKSAFWKLFPHMHPWWHRILFRHPPGTHLRPEWWQELEHKIELLPKFKFNCFIQAKRPEHMMRSDAAEYSSWGNPYFRFDTFPSQQKALVLLAQKTVGKAVVVYACPAFHTCGELWAAIKSGKLVKQSNFCEIAKLNGHSRYSFASAGNVGIAHSEPIRIESVSFEQVLDSFHSQRPAQSNSSFLASTADAVEEAAEQFGELLETYKSLSDSIFQETDNKLARSLARIYAFRFICNVELLIGYED